MNLYVCGVRKLKLSFVIPCYRSEKIIEMVINEITDVLSQKPECDYEIIAVNDCSPDNVYSVLKSIAEKNAKVKVIDFMQNRGKDVAVMAGLSFAKGDIAIFLDDDGQCPAKETWNLIRPIESGEYEVSAAIYDEKKEKLSKRFFSDIYQYFARTMLGQPKDVRFDNFTAVSKKVYEEMLNYKNPYPFLDGLILRVTKNVALVKMEERGRQDNNGSGYTFSKSLKMFMDGLTSFSIKPLQVASILGFISSMCGILYLIYTLIHYFVASEPVNEGYSSLLAVNLFIGGMIMMLLGLMGEYLGRIYICINQSPQFVIRETINAEKEE